MRLRAALSPLLLSAVLVVAGCGSAASTTSSTGPSNSSAGSAASAAPGASPSAGAPVSSAPPEGPQIPADTAVAAPVDPSQMPTVSGNVGDKPTITTPDADPPDSLQRQVLKKGDGPVSDAGSWLSVDYLGQVWGGKVFDNSYDRGQAFNVQVGTPQPKVVPGWNVGLQGVAQGSRVLLTLPPRDGYGAKGNPPKISGSDTLIFVIDVRSVVTAEAAGDPDAAPQDIPAGWPTVTGEPGSKPTVTIPDGLPPPEQPGVTIVATGGGEKAQVGTLLVQYTLTSWDGSHTESSWPDPAGTDPLAGSGPQQFPLSKSSPFASLIGIPIGSRVLLRTPKDDKSGVPALAWVIDLIAQQDVQSG